MRMSSVYRLTLLASLAFSLVVILLGSLFGVIALNDIEAHDREELLEHLEWLDEFIEEEGLEALAEEFPEEDPLLWHEEEGYWLLSEGEFAFLISDADGTPLLGLPELSDAPTGWSSRMFNPDEEEEEDGEPITASVYASGVRGEYSFVVARNHSWDYFVVVETLSGGLFFLIIISIPLSIVIGYALSRRVHGRLEDLAQAVGQIGQGSMDQRAAVSKRNDEFDKLALHVNAMLDRLEQLHRNIESVSVGVAHDIKTPLSRVSNRLQLMRQDIADKELLESHIDSAEQQIHTVLQTFGSLLRLSEIEAGDRRSRFDHVGLSALVEDIVDSYQPVFVDAGRTLEPAILPDLKILGDASLLTQMLSNLLENSIEHGRSGGKTWVRLQSYKDGVLMQVGDDGPGIPEKHHEQIFERFYRADASRSAPGNGLGLAIVRSICQLHGADIELLKGQKGAVFDCYFPSVPGH